MQRKTEFVGFIDGRAIIALDRSCTAHIKQLFNINTDEMRKFLNDDTYGSAREDYHVFNAVDSALDRWPHE